MSALGRYLLLVCVENIFVSHIRCIDSAVQQNIVWIIIGRLWLVTYKFAEASHCPTVTGIIYIIILPVVLVFIIFIAAAVAGMVSPPWSGLYPSPFHVGDYLIFHVRSDVFNEFKSET